MEPEIRQRTTSMPSQPTVATESKKCHDFVGYTYTRPTYCDLCSSFIWGLVKQGEKCQGCGYNVHKRCKSLLKSPCNTAKAKPANPVIDTTPPASPSVAVSDIFTFVPAETENKVDANNPPLSLTTMLKNNNRFVLRQGPAIWLNENITKLVTWHNPVNTILFLACYVIICSYPWLIPVIPQLIILYLIAKFYQKRTELIALKKPLPQRHIFGTPPKIRLTTEQTLNNLQQIQNTTGVLSDLYDSGYNLYKLIDWSTPDLTIQLMWYTLFSMVATWIILCFIPWNIVLLFGGVGIFIANTAVFKAASQAFTPAIMEGLQERIKVARKALKARMKNSSKVTTVVYENQRWWAGAGFVPFLLSIERAAWTDESGYVEMPPKDLLELPEADDEFFKWEWIDDDWEIDYQWSNVDEAGWEYTNNQWEKPKPTRQAAYTRRRRWIRRMKLIKVEQ